MKVKVIDSENGDVVYRIKLTMSNGAEVTLREDSSGNLSINNSGGQIPNTQTSITG